jgi:shikimate kinase
LNFYLIGMPGSGKTVTGEVLSKKLVKHFVDTDSLIIERAKKSISAIFEVYGEDYFRNLETDVLFQVSRLPNQVVATGGGIVIRQKNWDLMRESGKIIYLRTSLEWIARRTIASAERPLLNAGSLEERRHKIQDLLATREALYGKADLIIDTDAKTAEAVANEIIELLNKK